MSLLARALSLSLIAALCSPSQSWANSFGRPEAGVGLFSQESGRGVSLRTRFGETDYGQVFTQKLWAANLDLGRGSPSGEAYYLTSLAYQDEPNPPYQGYAGFFARRSLLSERYGVQYGMAVCGLLLSLGIGKSESLKVRAKDRSGLNLITSLGFDHRAGRRARIEGGLNFSTLNNGSNLVLTLRPTLYLGQHSYVQAEGVSERVWTDSNEDPKIYHAQLSGSERTYRLSVGIR